MNYADFYFLLLAIAQQPHVASVMYVPLATSAIIIRKGILCNNYIAGQQMRLNKAPWCSLSTLDSPSCTPCFTTA